MKALVVVDVQRDFVPGGALAVPAGDEVVPVANSLMKRFELVVATQDWHPPDHLSFAANHPGRQVGDRVVVDGLEQVLWPVHCVQETRGAAFAEGLDTSRIGHVVRKGTDPRIDSYSGFYDNARRKTTGLHEYLRGRGVGTVYVLGLATDYCVRFTVQDALRLGYETYLVVDGCRAVNLAAGDGAQAVAEMRAAGAKIVTSEEVLR